MNYRLIDNNNCIYNVLWQILTNTYVVTYSSAICRINKATTSTRREASGAFDSFPPVFNTLVLGKPLNSGPQNLASRN